MREVIQRVALPLRAGTFTLTLHEAHIALIEPAPDQAACWAAHVHAAAGQRLAARVGRLGFLARDLAAEIPTVFRELSS